MARRTPSLLVVCALAAWLHPLTLSSPSGAAPSGATRPDLGRDRDRLPAAPLVVVVPSVARASDRLYPLLARIGLALPEWDPGRMFFALRLSLGIDLFDPGSLGAAGIDSTGPLAIVDQGPLTHPVYLLRLLPGGRERLESQALARLGNVPELGAEIQERQRGLDIKGRLGANSREPRFAYALDGDRLAVAPHGCGRGLGCVAAALKPKKKLLQSPRVRRVLAGLPEAAAVVVAQRGALAIGPSGYIRRAADDVDLVALALDVEQETAKLTLQAQPSKRGKLRAARWAPLTGRAAKQIRSLGAASLWLGIAPDQPLPLPLPFMHVDALRAQLREQGVDLDRELRAIADGGVGLHLFDLEPLVPGLDRSRSVGVVMSAFFAEHGLWLPTAKPGRAQELVAKVDAWLKTRAGQFQAAPSGDADLHSYSEAGRVVDYGTAEHTLFATTGPGTVHELREGLGQKPEVATPGTLFALRADARAVRALLGRISLLGHGENQDLRAIWVVRQAAAPLLARLGAIRADLRRQGQLLRLESSVELRGQIAPR